MTDASPREYLEPYRQAVQKHGAGFEATLWGSRAAQERRFDVMIDMVGFDGTSVLDVGCGTGDFAARLLERGVAFDRFVGYDAMAEMTDAATARGLERCTFEARDVVADTAAFAGADADYACFSGTLNTMEEETARALVKAAYDAAHQGVVFNFLSDRPDPKWLEKDLWPARRFDTAAWVRWALSVTPRVQFAQDYLDGHDATIAMRH
jgi:SAM-dependent methyltransferase